MKSSAQGAEPLGHLVARCISALGHPFVLIIAFVLGGSARAMPWPRALALTSLVVAFGIGPIVFYLLRQVRAGRSNFDVSARELRGPVYALGSALGALLITAVWALGGPAVVLIAMACALAMVMIAALINLRLKVSLHSAFAIWVAIGWLGLDAAVATALFALTVAVAWSRLYLRRHSPHEVAAGLGLGAFMAGAMLLAVWALGAW